jgi:hypothetical protein
VNGVYQKKPKQIPRSKTSQLDAQSETQIEQWVKDYESRWEKNTKFQPEQLLLSDEILSSYLDKYHKHLLKYRSRSTADIRVSIVRRYASPYFLDHKPPLKDPQQWVGISIHLLEHLEKKKLSWSLMAAITTDLRGFYKYLLKMASPYQRRIGGRLRSLGILFNSLRDASLAKF